MHRLTIPTLLAVALFFLSASPPLAAQEMCNDGNFELGAALGPWTLFGDNTGAGFIQYDVDGAGGDTWCLKRLPGTDFGNGGVQQQVLLVSGVTYQFDMDVAYYSC